MAAGLLVGIVAFKVRTWLLCDDKSWLRLHLLHQLQLQDNSAEQAADASHFLPTLR